MKVAVLGAGGMLGRQVAKQLAADGYTVDAITRSIFDLSLYSSVKKLVTFHYDWIVNCAGIVKSRENEEPRNTVLVNAALPHWLEYEARRFRTRILHVSTDCVFSGAKGHYNEDDSPDPVDLYGASKVAGELQGSESLTIRTSFIGHEPGTERGLLAWFLRQAQEQRVVKGYKNALWSGLSSTELARVISRIIAKNGFPLTSVYHVTGGTISKCDLLMCLRAVFKLNVEIEPEEMPLIDRTLNGTRFRVATGYSPPTWNYMAYELAEEWKASR